MIVQPYRSFSVAKSGNRSSENEDFHRAAIPEARERPARFAVADGATEAALSREWARLLVNRFVDDVPLGLADLSETTFDQWLQPCREKWDRYVRARNIPWHGRAKVRAGAMATFLGVEFWQEPAKPEIRWRAMAVGDCCLFIVRGGCLEASFPTDDPGDFGNTPSLICSNPAHAVHEEHIQRLEGSCLKGDRVFLATDAVACWALTQEQKGANPWTRLKDICDGTDEDREHWVAERRADGSMRNDDATLWTTRVV